MGYASSMRIGSQAEQAVIDLLENFGLECHKSQGRNSFYDIETITEEGQTLFFEVKFDKMSAVTQNLAVEYFNPKLGKLSGISVTQSDFWVFAFGHPLQLWLAGVADLKDYIGRNPPFKVIDVGGDKNASLYLYKKDRLLAEIFIRIDNLEKDTLTSMFNLYINDRNENYATKEVRGSDVKVD
jgi:hypothetical protein